MENKLLLFVTTRCVPKDNTSIDGKRNSDKNRTVPPAAATRRTTLDTKHQTIAAATTTNTPTPTQPTHRLEDPLLFVPPHLIYAWEMSTSRADSP